MQEKEPCDCKKALVKLWLETVMPCYKSSLLNADQLPIQFIAMKPEESHGIPGVPSGAIREQLFYPFGTRPSRSGHRLRYACAMGWNAIYGQDPEGSEKSIGKAGGQKHQLGRRGPSTDAGIISIRIGGIPSKLQRRSGGCRGRLAQSLLLVLIAMFGTPTDVSGQQKPDSGAANENPAGKDSQKNISPLSFHDEDHSSNEAHDGKVFVNSLGMKFIRIPGSEALMCIHETRVKDYSAFKLPTRLPDFFQTGDHPVVLVSFEEAKAFCQWLSRREGRSYRLPKDHEWSAAAGLDNEPDGSPSAKDLAKTEGFAWGPHIQPSDGTENIFSTEIGRHKLEIRKLEDEATRLRERVGYLAKENAELERKLAAIKSGKKYTPPEPGLPSFDPGRGYVFDGKLGAFDSLAYRDGYIDTAPVMSYPANAQGFHDMGGNVSEYCDDPMFHSMQDLVNRFGNVEWVQNARKENDKEWKKTVLSRGGSYYNGPVPLSKRYDINGYNRSVEKSETIGFRIVLEK